MDEASFNDVYMNRNIAVLWDCENAHNNINNIEWLGNNLNIIANIFSDIR